MTHALRLSIPLPAEAPAARASPAHPYARLPLRRFATLLVVALVLRLVAMAMVPLIPEEAYYWMYAQHPSLSYYDHPPMVAWVIGLGTALFGNNEFGVRIVGNLMMLGASVLMYWFGTAWFSRSAALLSAILLQILPMYFGAGFIATMDSALLFFWMLGLVGVTAALRDDRPWGWYLAGFAMGAAMLSKYTGVFIGCGALLAVVAHRPWRRHLLAPHAYLGVVLAMAMFSPVVVWNAQHDWASFRFQFLDRFAEKPLSANTMLGFIGIQVIVATPLVLWACLSLVGRLLRQRRRVQPRLVIALAFSLPLLAVMAYKSARYQIHINWTLPAFLSLLPAVSQVALVRMRTLRTAVSRRRWAGALAVTAIASVVVDIALSGYLIFVQPHTQWISAVGPWEQLADIVEAHEDRLERESGREPLVVADGKYRLASVLAFYRQPIEHDFDSAKFTTSRWLLGGEGLAYPYWLKREAWSGRDCVYVVDSEDRDILAETRPLFDSVELVDDPRLREISKGKYRLALCRGLMP